MTIRFLQTVASETPDYPFRAGQVIEVPAPSGYLLSLCDGIRAEVVRADATERAVEVPAEQPEPGKPYKDFGRGTTDALHGKERRTRVKRVH